MMPTTDRYRLTRRPKRTKDLQRHERRWRKSVLKIETEIFVFDESSKLGCAKLKKANPQRRERPEGYTSPYAQPDEYFYWGS